MQEFTGAYNEFPYKRSVPPTMRHILVVILFLLLRPLFVMTSRTLSLFKYNVPVSSIGVPA